MVTPAHPRLSVRRQCRLLGLHRSRYYHKPKGESPGTLGLMRRLDALYLEHPYYGSRRLQAVLQRDGVLVGRHRIRRLMHRMGLQALYPKPRTSQPNTRHRLYPYLLRGLTIDRPNQVWCSDITFVPMARGFMYLTAVMDWHSRTVLSWRLSNTLDTRFCVEAVEEAIATYGAPEIFNTDQGCQYTAQAFTDTLQAHGIRISMDGKGRWMDNVMIERLWRSVKYECLYAQEFEEVKGLRQTLAQWFWFYNHERPHATLSGRSPHEVYTEQANQTAA